MTAAETEDRLSVIPEVFFDLISRVPAGTIVPLAGYILLSPSQRPDLHNMLGQSTLAAITLPILGLLLAYMIGLGFSVCSDPAFYVFNRPRRARIKKYVCDLKKDHLEADKIFQCTINSNEDSMRLQMQMHEYLKSKDPKVGLAMAKHQAEVELLANLTTGFMLLSPLMLYCEYISVRAASFNAALLSSAFVWPLILALVFACLGILRNGYYWRYHFGYTGVTLARSNFKVQENVRGCPCHWVTRHHRRCVR